VLGKTFSNDALAALAGPEVEIEPLLMSLVRKEVLDVQADPRSPEHGQYGFLQDLVRHVAYETLSRRERRARHVSAAEYLTRAFAADEDEVVEVIASHYLAAHEAVPDAGDAHEIRAKAQATLVRAAERAASLAASAEARRYYERAAELAEQPSDRATYLGEAGEMAMRAGDPERARRLSDESIRLHEELGQTHAAARVLWRLARFIGRMGEREEALARMERAFDVISRDDPDEDLALLAGALSLAYWFRGDIERAGERAELALDIAEAHAYPAALAVALRARGFVAGARGRSHECNALIREALQISLEHDLVDDASVLYFVLSDLHLRSDDYRDAVGYLDESLAFSRKLGSRPYEWAATAERTYPLYMLGRWSEALQAIEEFTPELVDSGGVVLSLLQSGVEIYSKRGELDEARRILSMFSRLEHSVDVQEKTIFHSARACLRRAEGQLREALADGEAASEAGRPLGFPFQGFKQAIVEAIEAAVALGEQAKVEELLALVESVPPGSRTRFLDAQSVRFRARLSGDEHGYDVALDRFRRLGLPFWIAVTLLERGELTGDAGSLAEAREIFEELEARPWLERVAAAAGAQEPRIPA
jgi:tetratricopeptide (TPR) repeat protein